MPRIWFTADTHFGHANIIKYTNRPFQSVKEMNIVMVENWNAFVHPDDEVYHLGDVALCDAGHLAKLLDKLNGKIYLIKGNHEKTAMACQDRFEWVKDYHELIVEDPTTPKGRRLIILMHYAMRVWNASHHGSWQLYGHSHGTLPDDPNLLSIDVGVDCHNFRPVSYAEVAEIMARKTWVPPFLDARAD